MRRRPGNWQPLPWFIILSAQEDGEKEETKSKDEKNAADGPLQHEPCDDSGSLNRPVLSWQLPGPRVRTRVEVRVKRSVRVQGGGAVVWWCGQHWQSGSPPEFHLSPPDTRPAALPTYLLQHLLDVHLAAPPPPAPAAVIIDFHIPPSCPLVPTDTIDTTDTTRSLPAPYPSAPCAPTT